MPRGFLVLLLHCHLPYVRHPEHEYFLEEDWLYEAVAEVYVPLLQMLERLREEEVPVHLTLSLSPTLCEMLANGLLRQRCRRYLRNHAELAEREVERTRGSAFHRPALLYRSRYRSVLRHYEGRGSDLLSAFRRLAATGRVELLGSPATHPILPLLGSHRARRAQIAAGLSNFEKHFGGRPAGFWLPECAYQPGLEQLLAEAGVRYFFLETHGVLLAEPRPPLGVFAPLRTPAGPFALGRDVESSRQVWSAHEGLPGDPLYREFHRDLGYDADIEYLRPHLPPGDGRKGLGFKYHRVTGQDVPLDEKEPYDPHAARRRAARHARAFLKQRVSQVVRVHRAAGAEPIIVCPYDGELFGHWWFEGLWFLEALFRRLRGCAELVPVTASQYLDHHRPEGRRQTGRPALSSWGYGGYFESWLNGSNDWMYSRLREGEERLIRRVGRTAADGPAARALSQAARQLMLAQASDWAFQLSAGGGDGYARWRFERLMARFDALMGQVERGRIDPRELRRCEETDDFFADADLAAFWCDDGSD